MKTNNLRILYNTAGNNKLGMGHIYVSLRLSNKFRERDDVVILYLLSSNTEKKGVSLIEENNYESKILDSDKIEDYIKEIKLFKPDVVINDILYIKEEFMSKLRTLDTLIVNIEHIKEPQSLNYADIIFNSIYPPIIDPRGKYYYGPRYAPLHDSFKNLPKKKINKECKNFLLAFGGSDPSGFTIKSIEALHRLNGVTANAIIGAGFKNHEELEMLLNKINDNKFTVLTGVTDLSPYMKQADIGLISGGNTCYELAATGTPGILISQNEMEADRAKLFSDYSIILNLDNRNLSVDDLFLNIKKSMNDYELRKKMSERGQELVDGYGVDRIVEIIFNALKEKNIKMQEVKIK